MENKIICKICNKKCKTYSALAYHVSQTHKIKSKIYYDLYLNIENKGKCKICGKNTNYYGLQKGYCNFCSTRCSNKDLDIKKIISIKSKIYSNSLEAKRIRSENGKKLKGIKRNEEFKRKCSERQKGIEPTNKGKKNYLSEITLKKMSKSQLQRFSKVEEIEKISNSQKEHYKILDENKKQSRKEKIRISQINRYSNVEERKKSSERTKNWMFSSAGKSFREESKLRMLNGQSNKMIKCIKKISNEEIKLREMIKQIYPSCEFQHKVLNYSLDVALPDLKIAIEYDGYYHFDTEEHKQYHKLRQEKIEKEGWKFLRYTMFDKFPNINQISKDLFEVINNE